MNAPVHPEGLRPIGEILRPIVADMGTRVEVQPPHRPAFVAEGNRVLHRATRQWLTPLQARSKAALIIDVIAESPEPWDGVHEVQLLDLVRAIRDAERFEPTPPVASARAA